MVKYYSYSMAKVNIKNVDFLCWLSEKSKTAVEFLSEFFF